MTFVVRAAWGARAPRNRVALSWPKVDAFVAHYSGPGTVKQTPRIIQDYHMDTNGWADIGYNLLVDIRGTVYEGRGWDTLGAHTKDNNSHTFGVCFIGGPDDLTTAAKQGLRWCYDQAVGHAGRPLLMRGHKDYNATDCPGAALYGWVHSGMPWPGTAPPPAVPPWPGRVLRLRQPQMQGADVRQWQDRMRARGWSLAADGLYGPRSREVCLMFQREKHLGVDGEVGPITWAASWTAPVT